MLPTPAENSSSRRKQYKAIGWIALIFGMIGIIVILYWWFVWRIQESTDDAYVSGNMVKLTAQIPGNVVAFYADDTDLVKAGQLLVTLDTTDYEIALDKAKANLGEAVRQVAMLQEQVEQSKATITLRQSELERALLDYQRRFDLMPTSSISVEDLEHARINVETAEASLLLAEHQFIAAYENAKTHHFGEHPLIVEAKTKLREAYVNLKRCYILSPSQGFIAQRSVEVGQSITADTILMNVLPLEQIWVDANFKETQLRNLRIGQSVTLISDVYGRSARFTGKVIGIAAGTGSIFSLLPPQNATGNWVKIVQRLPVRIILEDAQLCDHPLRIGLSMNVTVSTEDCTGPYLSRIPPKEPVATTAIYDAQLEGVEELIAEVMQQNLFIPPSDEFSEDEHP
jgi:membrane fusion protein (multidrug efflux system)